VTPGQILSNYATVYFPSVPEVTPTNTVSVIIVSDSSDIDEDGEIDLFDNCPTAYNPGQEDADGNGEGDACDPGGAMDSDNDGLVDNTDNCVDIQNVSQANFDGDYWGDVCEDSDEDSCLDASELGNDPTNGGQRDPDNPWDFFDPVGPRGGPPDGIIDLPNDLLGVIIHFSPDGQGNYDVRFDRGQSTGPNAWNMTAPDGVIDLTNDILGVILQFGHECR